jgi:hypothetical protein
VQLLKIVFPILVTLAGIVIEIKLEQLANAVFSILAITAFDVNIAVLNPIQLKKVESPIFVTVFGIVIVPNPVQP